MCTAQKKIYKQREREKERTINSDGWRTKRATNTRTPYDKQYIRHQVNTEKKISKIPVCLLFD